MKGGVALRLALIVPVAAGNTGCAVAAGIFRAGFWTGLIIAVLLIVGLSRLLRNRR